MFVETSVTGGVRKQLIHAGKGTRPTFVRNTKAIFHYRAIRAKMDEPLDEEKIAEAVIDDTRTMGIGPFELITGRDFKIKTWEDAVKEMLIGEVSRYYCPYQISVCYRSVSQTVRKISKAKQGGAPPPHDHNCSFSVMMHGTGHPDLDHLDHEKSPVAFEFELLAVEQPGEYKPSLWALSDEEILEEVPKLKEKGNNLYRSGDFGGATEVYREALSYLEQMSMKEYPQTEKWMHIEGLKVPLLLNFAQCKLMFGEYREVVTHTTSVLAYDEDNVKALFRRAKAHAGLWNLTEAERDFERVVKLNSSLSGTAERELAKLKEGIRAYEAEQRKKLEGRLFD